MKRYASLAGMAALCISCASVSEERVALLEEKVGALNSSEDPAARFDAHESMLVALQREISALDTKVGKLRAPASDVAGSASAPSEGEDFWTSLKQSVVSSPTLTDDGYQVSKAWLKRQVQRGAFPKMQKKAGGLKLAGVAPKNFVFALGFRNNDIILDVNGTPIDSVQSLENALGGDMIKVLVKRKKKSLEFKYSLVD